MLLRSLGSRIYRVAILSLRFGAGRIIFLPFCHVPLELIECVRNVR